jgi:hypothetical protein
MPTRGPVEVVKDESASTRDRPGTAHRDRALFPSLAVRNTIPILPTVQ